MLSWVYRSFSAITAKIGEFMFCGGEYREVDRSLTFPQVPKEWLYGFLGLAQQDEVAAVAAQPDSSLGSVTLARNTLQMLPRFLLVRKMLAWLCLSAPTRWESQLNGNSLILCILYLVS